MKPVRTRLLLLLAFVSPFVIPLSAVAQVTPCVPDSLSATPVNWNVDFATDVQPIFDVACSGCHIGGSSGGLSLAPGSAYANLVGVPASNGNAGIPRVTAGDPDASFLFKKLNCTNLNDIEDMPYGARMPRSGPPYLSLADQAMILDWIEQGARTAADPNLLFRDGFDGRAE
ncbi:hypothetical protein ACQQ2N_15660 [Dokdonella sp. MW10]|uniref:hypothetical protein n=1 Tax=Dokdonella sp. MW10 TaxID=2992926 RepID=UPI003F80BF9C